MFRGSMSGICPMCRAPIGRTMTAMAASSTRPGKEHSMLLIQVKLIEGFFTALQTQEIIERLTDAIVEIEGENMRPHTWCVVEEVASGEWGIGGRPLPPTTRRPRTRLGRRRRRNVRTGDPAEVQRRTFAAPPIMLPTRSTASRSERGASPARARSGSPAGPHRPVVSGGLGAKPITTRRRGSGARDVPQCARAPPGATRRQRDRLPAAGAQKHLRKPPPHRRAPTSHAPVV
jgi:4-oxalocrotonate tautomerase